MEIPLIYMLVIIISYNQDFFEQFVFLLTGVTSNGRITGMGNHFLLNATFPIGFFWRQFFFTLLILLSYFKQLFLVEMITLINFLVYVHVNYDQDFYTRTVLKLPYPGYGSFRNESKRVDLEWFLETFFSFYVASVSCF